MCSFGKLNFLLQQINHFLQFVEGDSNTKRELANFCRDGEANVPTGLLILHSKHDFSG